MTAPAATSLHGVLESLRSLGIERPRLVNDSRQVRPGDVFLAYPGERADGRSFVQHAVSAGAAVVLYENSDRAWTLPAGVPGIGIGGLRALAGELASVVHGHPSRELQVTGVTGTNGKTSCSQWIAAALALLGRPVAVIGTLGHGVPGRLTALGNTTPDGPALHAMLRHYRDAGVESVAMEVSSHGLAQDRLAGMNFDVALFTNLTRDHLDYHGDMESYGEAKARLFDWPGLRCAVINVDDAFGRRLVNRFAGRSTSVITYGLSGGAIAGQRLDFTRFGLELEIRTPWGGGRLATHLMGAYNAVNLLGVLGVLLAVDVPVEAALSALSRLEPVEGRMQTLGGEGRPLVVVDYAHTPDALEHALTALRAHVGGNRLWCVFGCGGDRDPGKRPQMGRIAARLADVTIVTSDNPRSEDPDEIIAQIVAGVDREVEIEADRAVAIDRAIAGAGADDVILIAGKGHERYQEVGRERRPFSDVDVARACLDARTAQLGSGGRA
jgi:UDP-N-acetylmuramoyl-L-alanyl-D-glutamate--2,6-diaminopimelate ligase